MKTSTKIISALGIAGMSGFIGYIIGCALTDYKNDKEYAEELIQHEDDGEDKSSTESAVPSLERSTRKRTIRMYSEEFDGNCDMVELRMILNSKCHCPREETNALIQEMQDSRISLILDMKNEKKYTAEDFIKTYSIDFNGYLLRDELVKFGTKDFDIPESELRDILFRSETANIGDSLKELEKTLGEEKTIAQAKRQNDLDNRCAVMDKDEMYDYINNIGRKELFDELEDINSDRYKLVRPNSSRIYPRYLKAIRVSLVAQGYDEHWVDNEFRDALEKKYLVQE